MLLNKHHLHELRPPRKPLQAGLICVVRAWSLCFSSRDSDEYGRCRGLPCVERTLPGRSLRRRPYSPLCYLGPQYVVTIVLPLPRRVNSKVKQVRQHQSAFIPLGPHVARDVPRRLIQLVCLSGPLTWPYSKCIFYPAGQRRCRVFRSHSRNMLSSLRPPDRGGGGSSRFFNSPQLTRPDVIGTPCDAENC
jgi:hypothetical protein